MCMCVDVHDVCVCWCVCVCVCVGGGCFWLHVVVNHLLILDSSLRTGPNHSKHVRTLVHKCAHLANYANWWLGRTRSLYSVFREQRGALKESCSASLMLLLFFCLCGLII